MPELNQIIVHDEAGREFANELSAPTGGGYISPFKRAIREIRATGTGILAGVQSVSDIEDSLKSNIATIIGFRTPNPREAREVAQLLGQPAECVEELQHNPVGVAFVRSEGFSSAIKVAIPNVDLGPYLSDEQVAAAMADELQELARNTELSPAEEKFTTSLRYQELLDGQRESAKLSESSEAQAQASFFEEHAQFLHELEAHPTASTVEHYQNLRWSSGRGNRVKEQLLAAGLIQSERQKSNSGRPREILAITEKGKSFIHANQIRQTR